jgi:hypothetical protein
MGFSKWIGALTLVGLCSIAAPGFAQNSTKDIGRNDIGPGPQPCVGFNCNQPPGPGYGQIPPCYAPNVLVQINEWNGVRYECRYVQTQPGQPIYPIQPQPGQYSQAHYLYCIARYKSYRQATNTYTSFSGQTKFCNSPFN